MKLWSAYHVARTVEEALSFLAQHQGRAQIVAGGTDLLLDIQQGNHPVAEALVDITRVNELTQISAEGDGLTLGAAVTHNQIVMHPILRSRATCLVESCGVVGGPQVRNVATIGGNVAHALPAADGTLSLVTLRAEAEVASPTGRTWFPIGELFLGAGKSRVDPSRELITRFRFTLTGQGEASAFKRIMRPQGVALPILGCAAWVKLDADRQHFEAVSLCVSPIGPTPARAETIEAMLKGQPATETTIQAAALQAQHDLHPRTSKYRATADYRKELIEVLVRQSLTLAVERAKSGEAVPMGVG